MSIVLVLQKLPPAPYAYDCVNKTEVSKVSPDS